MWTRYQAVVGEVMTVSAGGAGGGDGAVIESVLVLFEISGLGGRELIAKKYPHVKVKTLVAS